MKTKQVIILSRTLMALGVSLFLFACGEYEPSAPMQASPDVIYFLGDSITALKEKKDNYVTILQRNGIPAVSKGVGGNTASHLWRRLEHDVIASQPQRVFILIGINDADYNFRYATQTPREYRHDYENIINSLITNIPGVEIVLMTPFMIYDLDQEPMPTGGGYNNEIASIIDQYQQIVQDLGDAYGLEVIDLQAAMNVQMTRYRPSLLSTDAVHPTQLGQEYIAVEILNFLNTHQ